MKRYRLAIIALLFCQLFSSCELLLEDEAYIDPNSATLIVHMYGALSGESREGIAVRLYRSQREASENINPITSRVYTDEYGEAVFYDLLPDETYWIRGKALLIKSIRPTNALYVGDNYIEIPIL